MPPSLALLNQLTLQRRGIAARPEPIDQIELLERQAELQIDAEERAAAQQADLFERNRLVNANQLNDMSRQRILNVQALMGGASNSAAFLERRRPDVVSMDASQGTGTFGPRDIPEQAVDPRIEEQASGLRVGRQRALIDPDIQQHERNLELGAQQQSGVSKREAARIKGRQKLQGERIKSTESVAGAKITARSEENKAAAAVKQKETDLKQANKLYSAAQKLEDKLILDFQKFNKDPDAVFDRNKFPLLVKRWEAYAKHLKIKRIRSE